LTNADRYLRALKKLEQEPSVEAATLCYWSLPMHGSNSYSSLAAQDTIGVNARIINTTGGYINVFRMSDDPQRPFAKTPSGWDNVMLSQAAFDRFQKRMPTFSLDTPLSKYGDSTSVVTQGGKIGAFRTYRYGSDAPCFFYRMDENLIKRHFTDEWAQIVFRVKPAADGPDYRTNFIREIAPRLDVDDLFVADAVPYTEQQLQFEVMNGDTDKVNSQAIVVLFLLVNVFLGLIGTFWFRVAAPAFCSIAAQFTSGALPEKNRSSLAAFSGLAFAHSDLAAYFLAIISFSSAARFAYSSFTSGKITNGFVGSPPKFLMVFT